MYQRQSGRVNRKAIALFETIKKMTVVCLWSLDEGGGPG